MGFLYQSPPAAAATAGATPIAYAQLLDKATAGKLNPTAWYLLTDYRTTWLDPFLGITRSAPVEPLLVQASSKNALAAQGFSTRFPDDEVYYSLDNNSWAGATTGLITRRIDTKWNNDIAVDFRNMVFRRWLDDRGAYTAFYDNSRAWVDLPMFEPSGYASGHVVSNKWSFIVLSPVYYNLTVDSTSSFYYNEISESTLYLVAIVNSGQFSSNKFVGVGFVLNSLNGYAVSNNSLENFAIYNGDFYQGSTINNTSIGCSGGNSLGINCQSNILIGCQSLSVPDATNNALFINNKQQ